ncbi:hypothetical protein I4U23_016151 [Adineta vaga]|nr:hypothetical protein I4U23_016151 [Adineta vaga]
MHHQHRVHADSKRNLNEYNSNSDFINNGYIDEHTRVHLQNGSNDITDNQSTTSETVQSTIDESSPIRLQPFRIFRFADKWDKIMMIVGLLAAITSGAFYPLVLLIYQNVIDSFIAIGRNQTDSETTENNGLSCRNKTSYMDNNLSPYDNIMSVIKWYPIIGSCCFVLLCIAFNCWIISADRQVRKMRYALIKNIMRQNIGWFDCRSSSDLSTGLLVDALDNIREGIGYQVADCTALLARIIGCLVMKKFTILEGAAYMKANVIVDEVFSAIRTVTAFGGQKHERHRYEQNLTDAKNAGLKKGLFLGICQAFVNIALYGAIALIFWYGPYLARVECWNYDAGVTMIIFTSCLFATHSIAMFIPYIVAFIEASVSGAKVFAVIDRKSPIDYSNQMNNQPEVIRGDIELRNVTFNYPARKENRPILNNMSIRFPAGKTTGIVGETGCGKSTIIHLIQRFYDPNKGQVLLDNNDIRHLNLSWLRSNMAVVSQEPILFNDTIAENIRFGQATATTQDIEAAARIANIHDFIVNELPDGYNTLVQGSRLAGGQKQRIAIARAVLSNPKILLLDEATSALDSKSERDVQVGLERASQGRTTIVVAHRLNTIRNAHHIIGLKAGRIDEQGTHEDLMKLNGHYAQAVKLQNLADAHDESSEDEDNDCENENKRASGKLKRQGSRHSTRSKTSPKKSDDETKQKEPISKSICRKPFFLRILALNSPEWFSILLGSITSLIYGAVTPAYTLIFSRVFGLFTQDAETAALNARNYSIIVFFVGLAGGLCQFISSYAFARSGEALTLRMRVISFAAMLRQEMSWYDQEDNQHNILVTRLSKDAAALKGMTGVTIGAFLNAVGTLVAGLVISFAAGWKLTLVLLCFTPLIVLTGYVLGQRVSKAGQTKGFSTHAERGSMYATESLKHIRTVASLGIQNHFIGLYEDAYNKEFRSSLWQSQKIVFGNAIANTLMFFIQLTAFGYGVRLVIDREMTYVGVFQVFAVITYATIAFGRSVSMVPNYSRAKEAAIRIMDLNARKSCIDPDNENEGQILQRVRGRLEFRNVSFEYPSRKDTRALKHLSFGCKKGDITAVVGPSGSGKSTCIALLERFYDPQQGEVLLDGHDLRTLNVQWFRSIIGLVQQEPVLFNISIRDNIAYGDTTREFTDAEIHEAARQADIHDTIINLAQGYDTMCGSSTQGQLAGGQKQRICIARSLIRNPKIVLFDEANSALNAEVEQKIMSNFDQTRADRTCVMVTHRLSSIRNSEKIVVLVGGQVKEEGTDEQLAANPQGTYSELLKAAGLETKTTENTDETNDSYF